MGIGYQDRHSAISHRRSGIVISGRILCWLDLLCHGSADRFSCNSTVALDQEILTKRNLNQSDLLHASDSLPDCWHSGSDTTSAAHGSTSFSCVEAGDG